MAECREERRVPYRAAQMFDLVLDVERYREFMPFGFDAEIIRRATGRLWGHQALRLGPISVRFDTRVRYRRPDWIVVLSSGGPSRSCGSPGPSPVSTRAARCVRVRNAGRDPRSSRACYRTGLNPLPAPSSRPSKTGPPRCTACRGPTEAAGGSGAGCRRSPLGTRWRHGRHRRDAAPSRHLPSRRVRASSRVLTAEASPSQTAAWSP